MAVSQDCVIFQSIILQIQKSISDKRNWGLKEKVGHCDLSLNTKTKKNGEAVCYSGNFFILL